MSIATALYEDYARLERQLVQIAEEIPVAEDAAG
jgi:hypothetical protein